MSKSSGRGFFFSVSPTHSIYEVLGWKAQCVSVTIAGAVGFGMMFSSYFFLFISFGCGSGKDVVRPDESIPGTSEKPVASIDLLPDPLTRILNLKRDKPNFNIDVWTDKKRYRVGEEIRFYLRSDRDCYLTLIDYQTSGDVNVLFPNRYYQNNFIKAGRTYSILPPEYEFKLTVEPPPGIEKIKAIATTAPFSLFDLDFAKNFFPPMERNNTRDMRTINIALDSLPNYDWTENICTISIR